LPIPSAMGERGVIVGRGCQMSREDGVGASGGLWPRIHLSIHPRRGSGGAADRPTDPSVTPNTRTRGARHDGPAPELAQVLARAEEELVERVNSPEEEARDAQRAQRQQQLQGRVQALESVEVDGALGHGPGFGFGMRV